MQRIGYVLRCAVQWRKVTARKTGVQIPTASTKHQKEPVNTGSFSLLTRLLHVFYFDDAKWGTDFPCLDNFWGEEYNIDIFPMLNKGDFMKRTTAILALLFLLACVLAGCVRPISPVGPSQDVEQSTTEVPDTTIPEPPAPVIDLQKVLGRAEYDLITADPESQKTVIYETQTNLGNFLADAYRHAAGADMAIVCAGEIGAGVSCGEITVADVFATLPVECNLVTVSVTGAALLDCLEVAYQHLPRGSSEFLHLSGLSVVLDGGNYPTIEMDEAGNVAAISGDRRVREVLVGETPLQIDATYTIALSQGFSYTVADILGDDGVSGAEPLTNREAVMAYISDVLGGTVGEAYKNPFGDRRIRRIPLGQTAPAEGASLLPQVYITTENDLKRSTYVPCVITVHDPRGVYEDVYDTESTIKIRGHSTSSGEKTPYNIKFESKVELLGLGEGKKWNLLANLYDKTQLRNMLAYGFARDAGAEYTSGSCFAEVYFNGEYCGMYQICEPIGAGETRVDIDTDNNEFLMELEPYAGYSNPYTLTTPVLKILLGYNEPDPPTAEQRAWLKSFVGEAENALLSGDFSRVREYFDVESFARCYIVQELFKNVDYSVSSTRFFVKDNRLHEGPVWDFDLSAGNCSSSYYKAYNNVGGSGQSYEGLYCVGIYNQYLFRYEEFRQLVSELYRELQPTIIHLYADNERGKNRIDSLLDGHRDAIDRNYTVWSITKAYNLYEHKPVDGTYEGEIAYLKNWLEKRNEWLYNYYCADAP